MQPRTVFQLEVNPKVPQRLARLEELAANLWYSWDRSTRTLFSRLHTGLWDAVGHNPKAFLRRVDEQVLLAGSSRRVVARADVSRDAMLPFEPPSGSMTQNLRVVWTLLFRRLR